MTTNHTTLTAEEADWLAAYEADIAYMQVEAANLGWNATESDATSRRHHELFAIYRERHGEPSVKPWCDWPEGRERAAQLYAKRRAA